jgi:Icc-related predicted phosphoesterase
MRVALKEADLHSLKHTAAEQHSFVVLADPQLGMKHQYEDAANWDEEQAMFQGLVNAAANQQPDFLFVAGDMQNYWPNEKDMEGNRIVGRSRGFGPTLPVQTDDVLKSGRLGADQRASIKDALQPATDLPTHFTAGNHDVGDVPDAETIAVYSHPTEGWGPLWSSFTLNNILYVQFTSQFYWDHALQGTPSNPVPNILDADMEKVKADQNIYLKEQLGDGQDLLKLTQDGIKRLVLLTHIPPFMDTLDEKAGWANWKESDREWILQLLDRTASAAGVPVLWVCGHFHTNVEKAYTTTDSEGNLIQNDIIVTSSSGSTMWWDGANGNGQLSPEQAASVATKPVPVAFFQDIIQMGKPEECPGPASCRWNDLIQPIPQRSGMRIFKMQGNGEFVSEWKTLEALERWARRH